MINLLPYKEKKSIEKIRSIRLIRVGVFGVIIAALVAGLLLFPTVLAIESRLLLTTKQIKSLEQQGIIVSDVNITELQQRAQKVQTKLSKQIGTQSTVYISAVMPLVPGGVGIERLVSEKEKTLEIFGISKSREELQRLVSAIENNQSVVSVDSPVSNFVKNKDNHFKITVTFK